MALTLLCRYKLINILIYFCSFSFRATPVFKTVPGYEQRRTRRPLSCPQQGPSLPCGRDTTPGSWPCDLP